MYSDGALEKIRYSVLPSERTPFRRPEDIITLLIDIYREQSALWVEQESSRQSYWIESKTFFGALLCMDERAHFAHITESMMGLVKPFRAIGGKFGFHSRAFVNALDLLAERARRKEANCLVFVTYHHGLDGPGCAGWNFETSLAKAECEALCHDIARAYGSRIVPVLTEVETDLGELTIYGTGGSVSGRSLANRSFDEACHILQRVFPRMEGQMVRDLAPFMMGNARFVQKALKRPIEREALGHNGLIIAVGEGFTPLAVRHIAFMISDIDANLDGAIEVAATYLWMNLQKADPGAQAVLFTNALYGQPDAPLDDDPVACRNKAEIRSTRLHAFAKSVIRERNPDLWKSGRLRSLVGITHEPTQELTVISRTFDVD